MADLLIVVPTRGRPGNIRCVVDAWHTTGAFDDAQLLVAFDADDPLRDEYVSVIAEAGPGVCGFEAPQWLPMVHKLEAAVASVAGRHYALGFAGDDHIPRTIGWARTYLTQLRELGSGIVFGDDLYQGPKCPTQWAMTSDIVQALGRMVPAEVEHMYCDVAILDLGQAAGCIRYVPQVVIEHMHPIVGKAESDAQYERVNSTDQFARDRAVCDRWRRDQLPRDTQAVRALLAGHLVGNGKVSVLVPWRPDGAARDRAFEYVQKWWAQHHPDWQVVAGSCPDGLWHKAVAVADALGRADGDVLVVADADVVCDGIGEAVAAVLGGSLWAMPHGMVLRLTEASTRAVLGGQEPTARLDMARAPYPGTEGGGLVALPRRVYQRVPLDPRFAGWGQDDEAWALALRTMAGAPWRGDAPLFHLWHEAAPRQTERVGNQAGWALYQRYQKAAQHGPAAMRQLLGEFAQIEDDGTLIPGFGLAAVAPGPARTERAPVRFESLKYPNLDLSNKPGLQGVRFVDGYCEVSRQQAIAILRSPWWQRRGIRVPAGGAGHG